MWRQHAYSEKRFDIRMFFFFEDHIENIFFLYQKQFLKKGKKCDVFNIYILFKLPTIACQLIILQLFMVWNKPRGHK